MKDPRPGSRPAAAGPPTMHTPAPRARRPLHPLRSRPPRPRNRPMPSALFLALVTLSSAADVPPDHAEKMTRGLDLFRREIAPLLQQHCLDCHGGAKTQGDFDLATREGLLRGGSDGPSVQPFRAADSRLLQLVRHQAEPAMPKKKPLLPAALTDQLAAWIDLGAPYDAPLLAGKAPPRDRAIVSAADRQWWAFQPLASTPPPPGTAHPIDAFLLADAAASHLTFNPPASPPTLARRACLELTGLPPSPEEIATLDPDHPAAYPALLDRWLASPAYGERWARHWLDVARFAESSGFEHDYDRPHAYHYRDFVIRAFNDDMPFDQFARWQIAGDEFAPDQAQAMMATGFLGAGVFPTQITANEVERTRYDAMDDMLGTTTSAFLGLTVGCARCHDHKFDPIPAQDYYRLLATFTSTVRSNVDLEIDPAAAAHAKALFETETTRLRDALRAFETTALRAEFAAFLKTRAAPATPAWAQLDNPSLTSQAGATFRHLDDGSWLASGPNGPSDTYTFTATTAQHPLTAFKLEALSDPSAPAAGPGRAANGNFALSRLTLTAHARDGSPSRTVTLLPPQVTHQQNQTHLSGAAALDDDPASGWAVDQGGIGHDQAAAFTFAEPLDFPSGTQLTATLEFKVNTGHNLVRPRFSLSVGPPPDLRAAVLPSTVAPLLARPGPLLPAEESTLFDWWKTTQPAWLEQQKTLAQHLQQKPSVTSPVMVCAEGFPPIVMHSQGPPFLQETHLLKRGDPQQKQAVATPGFLQVLTRGDPNQWRWTPPPGARSSGHRRSLANWISDVDHGAGALLARVAVNRLWQHHFGRGLVATPGDFGKMGALPSHPALLDWLAREFIRHGWKQKPLHRLIMSSAAYQQSSAPDPAKSAADPDNNLFLRQIPRRLEGEAVRDSLLAVSGTLDRTLYGPGTLAENSARRSIYFTLKRSQLLNSMLVFDAPEPLTSQSLRPTTTVAPQALLFLNSPQVRQWSRAFATRVTTEVGPATGDAAPFVARAYQLAFGRLPQPPEQRAAAAFIAPRLAAASPDAHAAVLTDFCQALLALNEFIYVP